MFFMNKKNEKEKTVEDVVGFLTDAISGLEEVSVEQTAKAEHKRAKASVLLTEAEECSAEAAKALNILDKLAAIVQPSK